MKYKKILENSLFEELDLDKLYCNIKNDLPNDQKYLLSTGDYSKKLWNKYNQLIRSIKNEIKELNGLYGYQPTKILNLIKKINKIYQYMLIIKAVLKNE